MRLIWGKSKHHAFIGCFLQRNGLFFRFAEAATGATRFRCMMDWESIATVSGSFGKAPPNRDEALEKVYDFLAALAEQRPGEAEQLVLTHHFRYFRWQLDLLLRPYWQEMAREAPALTRDLAIEISDPHFLDESDTQPQFSSNGFELSVGERISMRVAIRGEAVPVCVNFRVATADELYFLRLEEPSKGFW